MSDLYLLTLMYMSLQKYLAEGLATFSLAFMVSASLVNDFSIATPILAALTVGLFVYTIGGLSGAHINPAVTVALLSRKKISPSDALFYILFQCVGALLALQCCLYLFGAQPGLAMDGGLQVGFMEALGAFFLMFGIMFVVENKQAGMVSGLIIGGSLLLGIMATSGLSNGVLNPAVSLAVGGINTLSLTYLLAPIVGAVAGAWSLSYLYATPKKKPARKPVKKKK